MPDPSSTPASPARVHAYAGPWSLWGLGVGAVIVGEFGGWNHGLEAGGFGGLFVATLIVTVLYLCLAASLAELGTAMPFAGGAYAYVRTALGPWAGYLAGLAQTIAYALTSSVAVVALGAVLGHRLHDVAGIDLPRPIWWLGLYALIVLLNARGSALFFRVAVALAGLALAVLAVFWAMAAGVFDIALVLDPAPRPAGTPWLPNGTIGVAWAIPFAIWFYLAIEQVPLAAEETRDPGRDLPRGLLWGLGTLVVATLLTLFLNAGVPPGAKIVARSDEPLLHAFSELIGAGTLTDWLPLLIGVGALSTAHSTLYAAGRSIFALGRAGYLPARLGQTRNGVPGAALLAAAAIGWAAALLVDLSAQALPVADVLIDMTALSAVASYALQFLSFIVLRRRHPSMARPFVSPLGATGAMTGLLIALFCLTLLFANRGYWPALLVAIALLALGALWFHWAGRPDARAPEEAFAERLERETPIEPPGRLS